MRFTFSIFFALFFSAISAQSPELENLVNACKRNQAYPDSLIKFGHQMLELRSEEAAYEGNFAIGLGYYRQGDFVKAIDHYKKALTFVSSPEHTEKRFQAKRNLAITYRNHGQPQTALLYLDTLETAASALKDSITLSTTYNTRGAIYKQMGNFSEAGEAYKMAFLLTPPKAYGGRANIALNLGVLYGSKQQYVLSEKWFRKTLFLAEKANSDMLRARGLNNLGYSKNMQDQMDSSLYFYREAMIIYRRQGNTNPLLLSYRNMAEVYLRQEKLSLTKAYLDSATQLLKKEDVISTALLNSLRAQVSLARNNPAEALQYVDEALSGSQQNRETDRLIANYRLKARILEALEQDSTALFFERKAQGLADSIQYFKDMSIIQSAAGQVELTQKEEEAQVLKASEGFWRSTLFIAALLGVALLFISLYFFRRNNRKKLLLSKREQEIEALNTQVEKAQTNTLHDKNMLLKSKAFITLEKLMYIEADGHYLNFYLEDGKETDRNSLKNVLEQLPEKHFIQIHRSFVVNLHYIRAIYAEKLMLKNGVELKVSRTFKQALKENWTNGD
jgi:tetratricopeptide (TPR) repeat protein